MVQRIVAAFTIAKVNFICFCIVLLNFADCNRHRPFHLTRIPPSPLIVLGRVQYHTPSTTY
ncbi:hypothetical protein HanIR_Chr05g0228151 [Helianthus annuus]|uniref:Uncharacterized protein n=1 Tax=Helianthus annuus TaxID=4232 RepID=A0A251UP51_HELAN|nr:hypothetical protein HanIR_Chr05g0228151 [Helianthus annuus]